MKKVRKIKNKKSEMKGWKHTVIAGILSSVLCVGLLSFSTYAMFTSHVTTPPSVVASADYQMQLTLQHGDATFTHEEKVEQTLSAGTYTVTLTATGTSTTGFAMFQLNGKSYYSAQVAPTQSMTFTLVCDVETKLVYDYQWGSHGRTENVVRDGDTVTVSANA